MKKTLLFILGGIVVIAILLVSILSGTYNTMLTSEQTVLNKQATVEVEMQRRFDLIPNLVNSAKGIMNQEQKVFGDLAEARTKYAGTQAGTQDRVDAANQLETSLGRLLVIIENYPELKSDQAVKDLMVSLEGTENRISVERNRYNEAATSFNTLIKTFPNNMLAGMFGFSEKKLFQAASGAQVAPVVDL